MSKQLPVLYLSDDDAAAARAEILAAKRGDRPFCLTCQDADGKIYLLIRAPTGALFIVDEDINISRPDFDDHGFGAKQEAVPETYTKGDPPRLNGHKQGAAL